MIPVSYITEWSEIAPWPQNRQVEQDLIICRALCAIYSNQFLSEHLAFRGGTALGKLYLEEKLKDEEFLSDTDMILTAGLEYNPVQAW